MAATRTKARARAKRRTRMRPEDRREQVLEVAAEVFAERGYRAASVSDIVERAGIGRGTFYLYFESKRDVFLELIELYFSEFQRLLTENHQQISDAVQEHGDIMKTWRSNVLRILQYHRDNPSLTMVIYRDALGTDEHFSARMDELSVLGRKQLTEGFRLLQDNGLMRPCDLELVTTVVMGAAVYVIMEHVVKGRRPDLERLADEFMEYHIRALVREDLGGARTPRRKERAAQGGSG